MFFVLSKALLFLTSPFFWFSGTLLYYFFSKNDFLKRRLRIFLLIQFFFFSTSIPFRFFVSQWEIPGTRLENVQHYELGVVLTGMVDYNKDIGEVSVRRGADRIWQTLNLYKMGKIDKILISGGSGYVIKKGLDEANQLKKTLVRWGVPESDIISESESRNTYENALFTKKKLNEIGYKKRFLLITSALHMRRARACYEAQNLKFDTFTTDHYYVKSDEFTFDWLMPSAGVLRDWDAFSKEMVGYVIYGLKGYL